MIDGINTNEEQLLDEKGKAIFKAAISAKQQAYRCRPINEKKLLKTASKFGQFADDYADAYRSTYQKEVTQRSRNASHSIYKQAMHCARRRFDNHEQLGAPSLEHISKKAYNKFGDNNLFYTACYATHYNNLLSKRKKPMVPSFNMPPLKQGNMTAFSQNAALENAVHSTVLEEPIDLRNSLSDSTENALINMLCDLKRPDEFTPDMVISVPLPVMFSSMSAVSDDSKSKEDNATQHDYTCSVQRLS